MYKAIKLHSAKGETVEVGFLANAATPLRFKMIFRSDLLTKFANAKRENEDGTVNLDIDFLPELAFTMAMQSKAADDDEIKLEKLSYNDFLNWLENLDSFTLENNAEEIVSVYYGNTETSSEAKKNKDEQSEK